MRSSESVLFSRSCQGWGGYGRESLGALPGIHDHPSRRKFHQDLTQVGYGGEKQPSLLCTPGKDYEKSVKTARMHRVWQGPVPTHRWVCTASEEEGACLSSLVSPPIVPRLGFHAVTSVSILISPILEWLFLRGSIRPSIYSK